MHQQHLGQGANQALEDCYHLIRLLLAHNPTGAPPSTELLSKIFTEFETPRIARTSELVKRARQQGDMRVVSGVEACKKRNDALTATFGDAAAKADNPALKAQLADLIEHPFKLGESQI